MEQSGGVATLGCSDAGVYCSMGGESAVIGFPRTLDFTDDRARVEWERSYPKLLQQYYDTIGLFARSWGQGRVHLEGTGGSFRRSYVLSEAACGPDDSGSDGKMDERESGKFGTEVPKLGSAGFGGDVDRLCLASGLATGGESVVDETDSETRSRVSAKGCADGETTLDRNRRWRRERKERKRARKVQQGKAVHKEVSPVEEVSAIELATAKAKETLARKWAMENELAAERARRSLEIIRASDLQDDIRRHTTRVKRHTEANMVAIEKTHKYLSKTGNVAGEPAGGQGFAETIIGESISPDSSASMQEFRAAQKQVLDLQARCEKLEKAYRKAGGNPDAIDLYDKSLFTMEDGTIAQHYVDQFADLKLNWGFPEDAVEYRNGKKKTRVDFYGVRDEDGDDFGNIYGDC